MKTIILIILAGFLFGCEIEESQTKKDAKTVERQQKQVSKSQPVPVYSWSLERHLLIQIYDIRNMKAVTHSVWRSNTGLIEGDCPSMGFSIPYDSSLTNPLTAKKFAGLNDSLRVVEQPEPNSIFASKNTSATWVLCIGKAGKIDPVYVESKVTSYPYPITANYETNRVIRSGKSTVQIDPN